MGHVSITSESQENIHVQSKIKVEYTYLYCGMSEAN